MTKFEEDAKELIAHLWRYFGFLLTKEEVGRTWTLQEGLTRPWRIAVPIAKLTCSDFADFEKKVEIFPSAGGVLYSPQDVIWPIWLVLGTWLAHMASRG